MAVEKKRLCGYRAVGATYLVADDDQAGQACERLPIPIHECPQCGAGIKQTRGVQWIDLSLLDQLAPSCRCSDLFGTHPHAHCAVCWLCKSDPSALEPEGKVALLWVGEQFYPTAESWLEEAKRQGISRRIAALPRGFIPGKTFVAVAHPRAIERTITVSAENEEGERVMHEEKKYQPAVIHLFRPERFELIVTPSLRNQNWVKELEAKGAVLVEVPENDPDHAPRSYKKSERKRALERLVERQSDLFSREEPPLLAAE